MAKNEKEEKDVPKKEEKDVPTVDPPKVRLDKVPMQVKCGSCKKPVETEVVHENGHCAYICALFLCVSLGGSICCCVPLLPGVNPCKDVHHSCPECGTELGTFHKNYLKDL